MPLPSVLPLFTNTTRPSYLAGSAFLVLSIAVPLALKKLNSRTLDHLSVSIDKLAAIAAILLPDTDGVDVERVFTDAVVAWVEAFFMMSVKMALSLFPSFVS